MKPRGTSGFRLASSLVVLSIVLTGCILPSAPDPVPTVIIDSVPVPTPADPPEVVVGTQKVNIRPEAGARVVDVKDVTLMDCMGPYVSAVTDGVNVCVPNRVVKALPCWADPSSDKTIICWPGLDVNAFERYPRPKNFDPLVKKLPNPKPNPVQLEDGKICRLPGEGGYIEDDEGNELGAFCGVEYGLFYQNQQLFDMSDPFWTAKYNQSRDPLAKNIKTVKVVKAYFTAA